MHPKDRTIPFAKAIHLHTWTIIMVNKYIYTNRFILLMDLGGQYPIWAIFDDIFQVRILQNFGGKIIKYGRKMKRRMKKNLFLSQIVLNSIFSVGYPNPSLQKYPHISNKSLYGKFVQPLNQPFFRCRKIYLQTTFETICSK